MFLILGLGFRCLQRGDILADTQDDEIGLEGGGVGVFARDVVADMVAFEIGDILDHDDRRDALLGGEGLRHDVDVILVQGGRGHAPVAVPVDVGFGAVARQAIADEENLLGLSLS